MGPTTGGREHPTKTESRCGTARGARLRGTSDVGLWNAGTEANQKPGVGPDQAPYQSGADTGAGGPDDTVRPAEDTFGNLPETSLVLPVTITPVP